MSNETASQFEPGWYEWWKSGAEKMGEDRARQLAEMVADAVDILKAESKDETDFIVSGVVMLMKNISEAAEKARSSIGQS